MRAAGDRVLRLTLARMVTGDVLRIVMVLGLHSGCGAHQPPPPPLGWGQWLVGDGGWKQWMVVVGTVVGGVKGRRLRIVGAEDGSGQWVVARLAMGVGRGAGEATCRGGSASAPLEAHPLYFSARNFLPY